MDGQTDIETEQSVQHNFDLNLRLFIFLVFFQYLVQILFSFRMMPKMQKLAIKHDMLAIKINISIRFFSNKKLKKITKNAKIHIKIF